MVDPVKGWTYYDVRNRIPLTLAGNPDWARPARKEFMDYYEYTYGRKNC